MWPVSQGASRRAHARAARGARVDGRPRRGGRTARFTRLIGAILAGGASSRFAGEPKGLSTVGGIRIIDRVDAALREVVDEVILVANDPSASTWLPGVRTVADYGPERGSLVGLRTALRSAAGAEALVVAWDMPFVTGTLFRALRSHLTGFVSAVIPETPRGLEPFCAAYSPRCLPVIEHAIDAGNLRASGLVAGLPGVQRLTGPALAEAGEVARLFFNVNTREDLALAERMLRV